jgi:hypothetical protein
MSIEAQIIDQRVRRLAEEFADPLSIQINCAPTDRSRLISAAFLFLVLKTVLDLTDDEAIDSITDGGQDFGVDALVLGPVKDGEVVVTLLQGKYAADLEGRRNFPQEGVEKMLGALGVLFDPALAVTLNPRLRVKIEEVRSLIAEGVIPTVQVIACNNGRPWTDDVQRIIDAAALGDQVSWQHIGPEALVRILSATRPVNDQISLRGQAIIEDFPNYRRALIGKMEVGQLAALFERNSDRLLERNIRRYLGLSGNRVNEAIQQTLSDGDQRGNFYFYNNGVTIICSKFRTNQLQREDLQVRLDGIQIVNGGQTSKTVQQVVKDCPEAASAQILVRIYELPEDDAALVLNITQATNSQNPVDLRDLRSNDERQKRLGQAIAELGYVYRRQRGDQPTSPRDITSATLAEAVLAVWRDRPHQARFNAGDHFGVLYDKIFTKDVNGAQAVIAVLLLRFAENKRKRPPADAPDFLPYASRHVAMVMGWYLLHEMFGGRERLSSLDHTKFSEAERLLDRNGEVWFSTALKWIGDGIDDALRFHDDRPLQKLSAQFRRHDLIAHLEFSFLRGIFCES